MRDEFEELRSSIAAAVCALALPCAAQAPPPTQEPWFKLLEARDGGYIATGKIHGATWMFRIPGQQVKSLGDPRGRQPMFLVDDVIVTVLAVAPSDYVPGARDPLAAQAKYEQDYQRKAFTGVEITELDMCKQSRFPHGGWAAKIPPRPDQGKGLKDYRSFPYQVYVTYQISDVVLMINSAYGDEEGRKAVAAKLDAICRSFLRDNP